MTNSMDRHAVRLTDFSRRLNRLERGAASPQLSNSSLEDGAVHEYDENGGLVGVIGKQEDGSHTHVILDGPTPQQPTDPIIGEPQSLAIPVTWDGNLISPVGSIDADLMLYADTEAVEIHVGATEGFLPDRDSWVNEFGPGARSGGTLTVASPAGEHWVRLRVRSQAGKVGPPSPSVRAEVLTLVDLEQFEDLRIELDLAADWIADSGADLDARLAAAQIVLDQAALDLENLATVTLPALAARLADAELAVEGIDVDALQAAIDAAAAAVAIVQDTDLPALRARLDSNDTDIANLLNTTLPALQVRLVGAEGAVNEAGDLLAAAFPSGAFDVSDQIAAARTAAEAAAATDAQTKATAAKNAAEAAAKAYADGEIDASAFQTLQDAAAVAQTKATAAQTAAVTAAATDATTKANNAKAAAITAAATDAQTKATAARTAAEAAAKAYADGEIDASALAVAQAAATDAQAKATAARTAAEAAAKTYTDTAKAAALAAAATAQTAANTANSAALAASGLAGSKGEVIYQASAPTGSRAVAQNLWIRTSDNKPHTWNGTAWVAITDKAATDAAAAAAAAQARAEAVKAEAIAAAAADATTKANAAQLAAINTAATDAQTKATAARNAAIAAAGTADEAVLVAAAVEAQAKADAAQAAAETAAAALVAQVEANSGKVWRQDSAPPAGATYRWTGAANNSASEKVVGGSVVAFNTVRNPRLRTLTGWTGSTSPAGASIFTWLGEGGVLIDNNAASYAGVQSQSDGFTGWESVTAYIDTEAVTDLSFAGFVFAGPVSTRIFFPKTDLLAGQKHHLVMEAARLGGSAENPGASVGFHRPAPAPQTADLIVRRVSVIVGESTDHFDGDTPDDRTNDLWFNTAEGNKPYAWDGATNAWVSAQDEEIAEVRQVADAAMVSANGKNLYTYTDVLAAAKPGPTPTAAFGAGRTANDVHRNRNASTGEIYAEWAWSGTAWHVVKFGDAILTSLDVGKLTAGTANIQTLVVQKMAAQVATIIELNASRITAGTIATGRLDATEIAAAVASVIELNASRITTGTIAAGRIDVETLAVAIASVIELNAGAITTGTLSAARINTLELAVAIASVIELNAGSIVSGTISAARIDVEELAGLAAEFLEINTSQLVAGAAIIDEAVINRLWTDVVRSRKITTDMLLVGSGENLIVDPYFNDVAVTAARDAASTAPWVATLVNGQREWSNSNTGTQTLAMPNAVAAGADQFYPVVPGETYRLRWQLKRAGTFAFTFPTLAVSYITATGAVVNADGAPIALTSIGTAWAWHEATWTAPEGAVGVYARLVIGGSAGATFFARHPSITSMADASLIVDGAIAARHVDAESVAAVTGEFVNAKIENLVAGDLTVPMTIKVGGSITLGATSGVHIVQQSNEITIYAPGDRNPDNPGVRGPAKRMTTMGGASGGSFVAFDPEEGTELGGVRSNGRLFGPLAEVGALTVGGEDFADIMNNSGGKSVGFGWSDVTHSNYSGETALVGMPVYEIKAGHTYRLDLIFRGSLSVAGILSWLQFRQSTGKPTLASPVLTGVTPDRLSWTSSPSLSHYANSFFWKPTSSYAKLNLLVTNEPNSGQASTRQYVLNVVDMGLTQSSVMWDAYSPPPITPFDEIFTFSDHKTFTQYGEVTDSRYKPFYVRHGQGGSSDYRTFLTEPASARSLIAGGGVTQIWVELTHAQDEEGINAFLGTWTGSAATATVVSNAVANSGAPKRPGETRWMELTTAQVNAIKAGAKVAVGRTGAVSDPIVSFYGTGSGTARYRPHIRIKGSQ